jgi:hypothetical protein
MFGLDLQDTFLVATFAISTLGAIVRLSIQVGRFLEKVEDHEIRLRRLEGRPVAAKVVKR